MSLQVPLERTGMREAKTAHQADKRFLSGMCAHVRAQVARHGESAVTDRAAKWLVSEVNGALVASQTGRAVEAHCTLTADERSFTAVRARVHLQSTERAKRPRTVWTRVRPDARVDAGVDRQQRRVLEASSAVGADVRSGVRVRALVVGTCTALREALGAAVDAADVRSFSSVCSHVRRQCRQRVALTPALTAHARAPSVAGWRGHGDGGGGAVLHGVLAMLMHCQQGRIGELSVADNADVITRRTTTTGCVSPLTPM